MGKTKYAAAVVAAKVSQTSGAQSVNAEAKPEVPKASALDGSPRAKKVNTRKPMLLGICVSTRSALMP